MNPDHHITPERLTTYFDGMLDPEAAAHVEAHVAECAGCRAQLAAMERARHAAHLLSDPDVPDVLWDRVEQAIQKDKTTAPRLLLQRPAGRFAVAAVLLVAIAVLGLFVIKPFKTAPDPSQVGEATAAFGFDYGLYLAALTEPDHLPRFEQAYNRQRVSLEEALSAAHVPVDRALLTQLPEGLDLKAVYVLTNAAARSLQVTYRHNGSEIDVFRQPKGQPVRFAGYRIEPAAIQGKQCLIVEDGRYCAVTFATDTAQYVVIGRSDDVMVAQLIDDLLARS